MSNQNVSSSDIKLKFLKELYSVCLKHVKIIIPTISICAFILFAATHEVEIASISDALNLGGLVLAVTASIMVIISLLIIGLGVLFDDEDKNGLLQKKYPGFYCTFFSVSASMTLFTLSLPLLKIFVIRFSNLRYFLLADILLSFIIINFLIYFRKNERVQIIFMILFVSFSFILCNIFLDTAIKGLAAWFFIMSLLIIFLLTISNVKSIKDKTAIWKSFAVKNKLPNINDYKSFIEYPLFETKGDKAGGNGKTFDWKTLEEVSPYLFILAGGISTENVEAAMSYRPAVVDVNSKVEIDDRKNKKLIEKIIKIVKS